MASNLDLCRSDTCSGGWHQLVQGAIGGRSNSSPRGAGLPLRRGGLLVISCSLFGLAKCSQGAEAVPYGHFPQMGRARLPERL